MYVSFLFLLFFSQFPNNKQLLLTFAQKKTKVSTASMNHLLPLFLSLFAPEVNAFFVLFAWPLIPLSWFSWTHLLMFEVLEVTVLYFHIAMSAPVVCALPCVSQIVPYRFVCQHQSLLLFAISPSFCLHTEWMTTSHMSIHVDSSAKLAKM